jgi:hypothetical protein
MDFYFVPRLKQRRCRIGRASGNFLESKELQISMGRGGIAPALQLMSSLFKNSHARPSDRKNHVVSHKKKIKKRECFLASEGTLDPALLSSCQLDVWQSPSEYQSVDKKQWRLTVGTAGIKIISRLRH